MCQEQVTAIDERKRVIDCRINAASNVPEVIDNQWHVERTQEKQYLPQVDSCLSTLVCLKDKRLSYDIVRRQD